MRRVAIAIAIAAPGCGPKDAPTPPEPPRARVPDAVAPVQDDAIRLRADLSELPAADVERLATTLQLTGVDRDAGWVTLGEHAFMELVVGVLERSAVAPRLGSFDFYGPASYVRLGYWENVIGQLPSFVAYGEHPRYEGYQEDLGTLATMQAYLTYRLDRSPQHVRSLFARARPIAYGFISPVMYESTGLGRTVRGLLESHHHVVDRADYATVMAELDTAIRAHDAETMFSGERTRTQVGIYADLGLMTPSLRGMYEERGQGPTDEVWFSSFWLRRYREENTDEVFAILKDIHEHYGQP